MLNIETSDHNCGTFIDLDLAMTQSGSYQGMRIENVYLKISVIRKLIFPWFCHRLLSK